MSVETSTPAVAVDLDFVSGANMVAARSFIEAVGLMKEDYFLYYEEVDWAARRGAFPLVWCREALVAHHVGTAIGSGSFDRQASAFAEYFNNRNRMWFIWRFRRWTTPFAYAGSLARSLRLLLRGDASAAISAFMGISQLPPPRAVRAKVADEARDLAFRGRSSR